MTLEKEGEGTREGRGEGNEPAGRQAGGERRTDERMEEESKGRRVWGIKEGQEGEAGQRGDAAVAPSPFSLSPHLLSSLPNLTFIECFSWRAHASGCGGIRDERAVCCAVLCCPV